MRKADEIQPVHDLLHAIIDGEIELDIDAPTKAAIHATHDALCWVLGCVAGEVFTTNIESLRKVVVEKGYEAIRIDCYTNVVEADFDTPTTIPEMAARRHTLAAKIDGPRVDVDLPDAEKKPGSIDPG